ncbi:nucleotide exchange factor GrpE [Phycicoccus sp. SLBN-51]|uniref:nucleotide exchange factor GrpE n=1 Tax=Phycicoccus sp. SLBN-51 TaxID=2768447 RepID=UPI001172DFD3|nr:nucleotide exchange factor GrpE [Phycicoccus sp. SLBN-51]TQJ48686.1 molecular chaperone GrpE [Phycicoccus sp. SLBN-51]
MTENVDPRPEQAEEVVGAEAAEASAPAAPAGGASGSAGQESLESFEQELEDEQDAVAHQAHHAQQAQQVQQGEATAQGEQPHPDTTLAAERLLDLQRLQAEYVNYKRRVDRDRAMVQERAVRDVLETLLPVLDDIHAAREHGDLQSGPFASIADKLEQTLTRFGLTRFGDVGEPFDPMRHEALMHTQAELPEGTTDTTVVTVLQPGYRAGEQVIRPARVAVADPQ